MASIKVGLASKKDKKQLSSWFRHYKVRSIAQNRADCYLSHNFTVIVKDKEKIVGTLQWYVKEDPNAGVVEFEEVHVLENYRGKGIGSSMVKQAIQSVKSYFAKIDIKPRRIFLFVSKKNKIARSLYEKRGFKLIAELNDLFSENSVELFYCLDLGGEL